VLRLSEKTNVESQKIKIMEKERSNFKSKLEVNELFVKAPVNLKCVLSQNERDFLEAVIHLQSLGKYHTSDSVIMANSGLNSNQITKAKQNLIRLDLLEVANDKSPLGSRYVVKEQTYNRLLKQINALTLATERFEAGDGYRVEHGLEPIFTNIINTLRRRLTSDSIPDAERITRVEAPSKILSAEERKKELRQMLRDGLISNEDFYEKIKVLNN
jgi:hypothetical protein